MTFVALLELKCDGDCVDKGDVGVGVNELTAFLEETCVSEAKCPCSSPFFRYVGVKVLTEAHGKEDGGGT